MCAGWGRWSPPAARPRRGSRWTSCWRTSRATPPSRWARPSRTSTSWTRSGTCSSRGRGSARPGRGGTSRRGSSPPLRTHRVTARSSPATGSSWRRCPTPACPASTGVSWRSGERRRSSTCPSATEENPSACWCSSRRSRSAGSAPTSSTTCGPSASRRPWPSTTHGCMRRHVRRGTTSPPSMSSSSSAWRSAPGSCAPRWRSWRRSPTRSRTTCARPCAPSTASATSCSKKRATHSARPATSTSPACERLHSAWESSSTPCSVCLASGGAGSTSLRSI